MLTDVGLSADDLNVIFFVIFIKTYNQTPYGTALRICFIICKTISIISKISTFQILIPLLFNSLSLSPNDFFRLFKENKFLQPGTFQRQKMQCSCARGPKLRGFFLILHLIFITNCLKVLNIQHIIFDSLEFLKKKQNCYFTNLLKELIGSMH